MSPTGADFGVQRRPYSRGEISGAVDELANFPAIASEGPPMLCKQHGIRNCDARPLSITILVATGQFARKRASENPEAESYVAKERALLAVLHSAFVANMEVVKHHGQ